MHETYRLMRDGGDHAEADAFLVRSIVDQVTIEPDDPLHDEFMVVTLAGGVEAFTNIGDAEAAKACKAAVESRVNQVDLAGMRPKDLGAIYKSLRGTANRCASGRIAKELARPTAPTTRNTADVLVLTKGLHGGIGTKMVHAPCDYDMGDLEHAEWDKYVNGGQTGGRFYKALPRRLWPSDAELRVKALEAQRLINRGAV